MVIGPRLRHAGGVDGWQDRATFVATTAAWVATALLALVALLTCAGLTIHPWHAGAQALTPVLLVLALLLVIAAVSTRRWSLAIGATAVLVVYALLVAPALLQRTSTPRWARSADPVSVAVANVRWDNPDPVAKARQLLRANADVMVVVELSTAFARALDGLSGGRRYPHRLIDPHRHGAGGIGLYSKRPLLDAQFRRLGPRRLPTAAVRTGGRRLELVGLHVPAPTGDRMERWDDALGALDRYRERTRGPLVLAGDFNANRWHPAFAPLLDGMQDVHEVAGKPFSRSWPDDGPLLGLVPPLTRLDHALVSDGVAVVGVEDLGGRGSDHRGFVATVAVRPRAA